MRCNAALSLLNLDHPGPERGLTAGHVPRRVCLGSPGEFGAVTAPLGVRRAVRNGRWR